MGLINLKFRNSNVSIVAEDEQRTAFLAERLNQRLDSIAGSGSTYAVDNKIAFIAGLLLEDELDRLKTETKNADQDNSDDKVSEVMCEALDQVSQYIESLAERLEKGVESKLRWAL